MVRLVDASADGNVSEVSRILRAKTVDINNERLGGKNSLHFASENGHAAIVELLLHGGADVNAKATNDCHALHFAAKDGHTSIVELLLQSGADVNAKTTNNDCTALHFAVESGHLTIVELLLQSNSVVNAKTKAGCTALHFAAGYGHTAIFKLLLQHGADVNAKPNDEWTALHFASQNGHADIVEFLLQSGADVNAKTINGCTALYFALQFGHRRIVELLILYGSLVDQVLDELSIYPEVLEMLEDNCVYIYHKMQESKIQAIHDVHRQNLIDWQRDHAAGQQRAESEIENLKLQIRQVPKELRHIIQKETDWIQNNKFDTFKYLLNLEEFVGARPVLNDRDEHRLMNEIEEGRKKHLELNDRIQIKEVTMRERKELIRARTNNLKDLLTKLDDSIEMRGRKIENLSCQLRSGDLASTETKNTERNKQFDELMRQREEFHSSLSVLIEKSRSYLDCLSQSENELNRLHTGELIEKKSRIMKDAKEEIESVRVLQDSCNGLKQQMQVFDKNSDEAQHLIEQFASNNKQKNQLLVDSIKIDLEIARLLADSDEDESESNDDRISELTREKEDKKREIDQNEKEKRDLEKNLSKHAHYGEIKMLLPKYQSTDRRIKDFTYVRDADGRHGPVKLYENIKGELVVLTKFLHDGQHCSFEREAAIQKLRHPLILPINTIFYEGDVAYVEAPFVEGRSMRDWMKNGKEKTGVEIQSMIRLVAQGIQYLHNKGVIHGDLTPESILMKQNAHDETCIPIICDLELINNKNVVCKSTLRAGAMKYTSPERTLHNEQPSTKADVWSLGIIILELLSFPREITAHIATDLNEVSSSLNIQQWNENLQAVTSLYELLVCMLKEEVDERFEISDVLNHAFLNSTIEKQKAATTNTEGRLSRMKQRISNKILTADQSTHVVRLSETNHLMEQLLDTFYSMTNDEIVKKLIVSFDSEEAIGSSTLTTSLYSTLFNEVAGTLLEKVDNGNLFIPMCDDSEDQTKQMVNEEKFEAMGKALIKIILDQKTIPLCLAPYFMRYLLCSDEKECDFENSMIFMRDVDMIDSEFGRTMRHIMAVNDFDSLCLNFTVIDANDNRIVDKSNKKEFIKKRIQKKLFGDRMRNMKAVRKGFRSLVELQPYLDEMNERDLAILIAEQQFVDKEFLLENCIDCRGDANDCSNLIHVLQSLNNEQLQLLLFFATGQAGMFNGGSNEALWNSNDTTPYRRDCITFRFYDPSENEDSLPVAHLCFYCIDMPKCDSVEMMKTKLIRAIEAL